MDKIELQTRTKTVAVNILMLVRSLPSDRSLNILVNQLVRSATSVGANCRSACKGKSTADFINKIIIVEEEADETIYWVELIEATGLVAANKVKPLLKEANELTAIFTAIGKTAKASQKAAQSNLSNTAKAIK